MNAQREKVQFKTNVPVELALEYTDGRDIAGNYGDQVMYTTQDDRVMFVPPIVRDRIEQLGVQRGEPIRITKAEVRHGIRRSIEYQVGRVEPPPQQIARPDPTPISPPQQREENPAPNQSPGRPQPTTAAQTDTKAAPANSKYGAVMLRCLVSALETVREAEAHAASASIPIRFTSQDIQGIASTFFIQAARDGWLNGGSR